jgi:hypothetical protein
MDIEKGSYVFLKNDVLDVLSRTKRMSVIDEANAKLFLYYVRIQFLTTPPSGLIR